MEAVMVPSQTRKPASARFQEGHALRILCSWIYQLTLLLCSSMAQSLATPFLTDPSSEVPVGVQLAWRLRSLITTGGLRPGERLPSFRQLASWAGVNVNTVRSVYARLEQDGLVVTRHGQGTFVAEDVIATPGLEAIANEALRAATEAGFAPRDLAITISACADMAEAAPAGAPSLREAASEREPAAADLPDIERESEALEVRHELRRQIGRLEAALSAYTRDLPPAAAFPAAPGAGQIAGVADLERTRDALIARLSEAQQAAAERARREDRARARREAMLREPERHKWEVVSDAETGEPGCREYRVEPTLGPLGQAVNWWRVRISGGCPLAVPREAAIPAAVGRFPAGGRMLAIPAHALSGPASLFREAGAMVTLTARTVHAALAPPYPYGEELVGQFLFVLKLSWFPLLISTFALNLGAPGLQAAGILSLFGSLDRLGGFFVLTAIRWIGPLVTAVVVAGVAGTAITADLGARKIREELDALHVLGVDPVKNLVVPRFLALIIVTGLLDIFAIVTGLSAGIAAELLYHQPLGGFFATLFSNATVTDLWASVLMCTIFGAIIAIVCSYKGMTASGGAAGVGRAVNQAVVIALVAVFFVQFSLSSVLLATNPELQSIR
jgi:phospholipid/cholesterol/gamma-HCH transport system permease protein